MKLVFNIWIVKAINSMKQRTTGHLFPIYCVSPLSNNIKILGTALPTAPTLTEEYLPRKNRENLHCNQQQSKPRTRARPNPIWQKRPRLHGRPFPVQSHHFHSNHPRPNKIHPSRPRRPRHHKSLCSRPFRARIKTRRPLEQRRHRKPYLW
jgi:hypothetical protein